MSKTIRKPAVHLKKLEEIHITIEGTENHFIVKNGKVDITVKDVFTGEIVYRLLY